MGQIIIGRDIPSTADIAFTAVLVFSKGDHLVAD